MGQRLVVEVAEVVMGYLDAEGLAAVKDVSSVGRRGARALVARSLEGAKWVMRQVPSRSGLAHTVLRELDGTAMRCLWNRTYPAEQDSAKALRADGEWLTLRTPGAVRQWARDTIYQASFVFPPGRFEVAPTLSLLVWALADLVEHAGVVLHHVPLTTAENEPSLVLFYEAHRPLPPPPLYRPPGQGHAGHAPVRPTPARIGAAGT